VHVKLLDTLALIKKLPTYVPDDIMFGALNRFIGRLDAETPQQGSNGPGDSSFGFQVLRNKDPDLPLEPWFDFIIGINGRLIVGVTFNPSAVITYAHGVRYCRMILTLTCLLWKSATALDQACP
jgi:hypothetical protein